MFKPGILSVGVLARNSASSVLSPQYWIQQSEVYELWKVTGAGNLVGLKRGDILTVGGTSGSYTFQVPNTAPYTIYDTDHIWFKPDTTQRITTEAELIRYDLPKTIVKYLDVSPYTIDYIMVLNTAVTGTKKDKMFHDFHLSIFWDDSINTNGYVKMNRGPEQSPWLGDLPNIPTGLTLSLISGGVKVDWTDNTGGVAQTEIWAQNDGGTSALLYTINAGIVTKNDTCNAVDLRYYKLRAKDGSLYSDFTAEVSISMLGAEEIINGGFSADSNWSKGTGWAISGGTMHTVSSIDIFYQTKTWSLNQKYRLRFDVVVNSGQITVPLNLAAATIYNTSGTKTLYFTCLDVSYGYLTVQAGAFNGSLDNVSIKKVL
jgi:hypothetical protein